VHAKLAVFLAILVLASAGTPRCARSGALAFGPALDLEVRQDQLPGAGSTDEGWIARLSPRLSLTRTGVGTTLELTGVRSFDSNQRLSGPTWVGDDAGLRFVAAPAPHSQLTTNAGYVSSRDPLGTHEQGPVTFSESAIASGSARLELWRLEGDYDVRSHTYEMPGHLDGFSQNWGTSLFPFRRPDTQGVLSVRGREVKIEKAQALSTVALTTGMRRTHFEGLASEFEVGAASTRDPVRGTNSWDLAVVAGATVDRAALRQPFDLRFRFMRDVATTGFAEASLPGRRSRLAVRWEQDLGAEGGYFQDPTLSRYLTFEAGDTLMGDYVVTLEGSFGQTRSFFENGPWLTTNRAWASLSRRLFPWLSAAVDYSFVNQDGDSSVPSWVFQRNRVGLRLTMGAQ
jgi:hypothetical protein